MSAQCLPNVCPMSAQCPQFPLNVPYVCLMFLISAQCPICLPNVPNFCPMSFAVKSRISSDMFNKVCVFQPTKIVFFDKNRLLSIGIFWSISILNKYFFLSWSRQSTFLWRSFLICSVTLRIIFSMVLQDIHLMMSFLYVLTSWFRRSYVIIVIR